MSDSSCKIIRLCVEEKTVVIHGNTWDDIKNHPLLNRIKISETYRYCEEMKEIYLAVKGDMGELNDYYYVDGHVTVKGRFKTLSVPDANGVSKYMEEEINMDINFKDNMLDGEYNISTCYTSASLSVNNPYDIQFRYFMFKDGKIMTYIYIYLNNIVIKTYENGKIQSDRLYRYFERINFKSFLIIYPEMRSTSKWEEKVTFIKNLVEGRYQNFYELIYVKRINGNIYTSEDKYSMKRVLMDSDKYYELKPMKKVRFDSDLFTI